MLKRLRNAAWIALSVIFFTFYGYIVWISSVQQPHRKTITQAGKSAEAEIDPRKPDERIADYTLWLERFTGLLALVTAVQFYFLTRANKTARIAAEATVAQMRAYISVVSARVHGFDQCGPIRVQVRIRNSGGTAAFDVTCQNGVTVREATISSLKGELWPPNRAALPMSRRGMAPKTWFDSVIDLPTISPEIKEAIRDGSRGIFAYGEILYKDALRNPRHTAYRLVYGGASGCDPEGLFVVCEQGNDSD